MDKAKVLKVVMSIGAGLLTVGASLINSKLQDDKMNETVAEKVAEALNNQAKES